MNGTTNPVKQFSVFLDFILNQIHATYPDTPETLKATFQIRWLPYLVAAYPIDVRYVGDGIWAVWNNRNILSNLSNSWERDIMRESLMVSLLAVGNYTAGIYITKSSPYQKTAAQLVKLGVITSTPIQDGRHTFTRLKAIPASVYFGMVAEIRAEQGEIPPPTRSTDQSAEFAGTPPTEVLTQFAIRRNATGFYGVWDNILNKAAIPAMFTPGEAEWLMLYCTKHPNIEVGEAVSALADYMKTNYVSPSEETIYADMLARGMHGADIPPAHVLINAPLEAVRQAGRGINNPDFPGYANLPPARPVAVTEADLVLAVRRIYEEFGRVNQSRLLQFIIKVLAGEIPDESLDPQPLIDGLGYIASGMTGDFSADYVAQQALYAYRNRQTLTVATGVASNEQ